MVSGLEEDLGWGNAMEERMGGFYKPAPRSGRRTNNWLCRTSISYSAVIPLPRRKIIFAFSFSLSFFLSPSLSLSLRLAFIFQNFTSAQVSGDRTSRPLQ